MQNFVLFIMTAVCCVSGYYFYSKLVVIKMVTLLKFLFYFHTFLFQD